MTKIKKRPPSSWKQLPIIMDSELTAIVLGFTPTQLRTLAKEGKVPAFKVGQQWRFEKSALMKFVGVGKDESD